MARKHGPEVPQQTIIIINQISPLLTHHILSRNLSEMKVKGNTKCGMVEMSRIIAWFMRTSVL